MAKRTSGALAEHKTLVVSVVGLSGTEKDKGTTGIGKSCLCNRFMRPMADDYYTDHITVLSQSDFGGRVVNNDHFLYWGEVTKTTDEGQDFTFHVIEQTEFIDDSSFQPFKIGKTEPYYKRCGMVKIQSAEKLMYICKNQLGLEHEFEQRLMPDGRLAVDGFLCLYDTSPVNGRTVTQMTEYTNAILQNLIKTKKPIVLVTSKHDEFTEVHLKEAEKMVQKFKVHIPIVESSAHANVNVEAAFLTLAQIIDRSKTRPKIVPYTEAARARREVLDVATEAYRSLIRTHVTDYKALWIPFNRRQQRNSDYLHFVELFGTEEARKLFRKHVLQLREEFVNKRQDMYLKKLETVLKELLPDLSTISDRSWPSVLRWLPQHSTSFNKHFVRVADDLSWKDSDLIESSDERIPYDLLDCKEAELKFRDHVRELRALQKKQELKKQFEQQLASNQNVCPGKSLSEVAIYFLGRECFSALSEQEKASIYEHHQRKLREEARADFQELLLESADWLARYHCDQVTSEDLRDINSRLANEPRYQALGRLEEDRKVLLLNHLGFIQCPSQTRCPSHDKCVQILLPKVLETKAHRPQSWSQHSEFLLDCGDKRLNLVLLGIDGLSEQLAKEIRLQCVEDEYTQDGCIYSLDYRLIDGDVSLPVNSFKTAEFSPHGCFCVYNSQQTLQYIYTSLEQTLLSELDPEDRRPFQGLPVVVVLAHNPKISDEELMSLRDQGQCLCDRLQCPFIDIPSSLMDAQGSRRFQKDQISLAMHSLLRSIQHRCSFLNTDWEIAESIEPDIKVLMCFMCGDNYLLELPIAPLLNHQCCYVTSDQHPTLTLETYLDNSKRKVEVTLSSYHNAIYVMREEIYHGYILIYSAKRRASLATLSAFTMQMPRAPLKILALTESGGVNAFFASEQVQALITEGNHLADKITANFMVTGSNFQHETASYTPFFNQCWEKKSDTLSESPFFKSERIVSSRMHAVSESIKRRPPAALPQGKDAYGKSSSNSTEDSDPLYDVPRNSNRLIKSYDIPHSDSEEGEEDRISSTSPSPRPLDDDDADDIVYPATADAGDEEVYEEIVDTEQLIKGGHVKNKRSAYAEKYRRSYPSASSSFASSSYREDSTDTDSSIRSPKLAPIKVPRSPPNPTSCLAHSITCSSHSPSCPTHSVSCTAHSVTCSAHSPSCPTHSASCPASVTREPQYQFRKSNSMKQAIKEGLEGIGGRKTFGEVRRRLMKASTLPNSARLPENSLPLLGYDESKTRRDKRKGASRPRFLDHDGKKGPRKSPIPAQCPRVTAPLATPEAIEIGGDYAQVKDAVPDVYLLEKHVDDRMENNYASVADALPAGHIHRVRTPYHIQNNSPIDEQGSDSDSEHSSSLERTPKSEDIYSKVQRRPTPHKGRHRGKSSSPRYSEGSVHVTPPPLPAYSNDRQVLVNSELRSRVFHSASEGSEGTGDEQLAVRKSKRKTSFKKKKKREDSSAGPFSDSDQIPLCNNEETYEVIHPRELAASGPYADEGEDTDGFNRKLKKKLWPLDQSDKMRRKEEKRAREDEKRKQKEQQKAQRKSKKKDGKGLMIGGAGSGVGGYTLEELAQFDDCLIPLFVEKCVNFIEEEGMSTEGLYRVPGNRAHVELLTERFKEDRNVDIRMLEIPVNAVATALKQFFSDLSEPVVPKHLYDELTEAAGLQDKSTKLVMMRGVLKKLPPANYQVLQYIITHINRVSERSSQTSMDSKNLAICWWPTLLRPEITSLETVQLISRPLEEFTQTLIEQCGFFFYENDEV